MGIVLDNGHVMSLRQAHQEVHFAADSGIVHRDQSPGVRSDQPLHLCFVDIKGIRADVRKHWCCSAQHEGVDRRNKGERRNDHLVSWLDPQQQGCHFQRMGTRSGQQNARYSEKFFQHIGAAAREWSIAGKVMGVQSFAQVSERVTKGNGPVERDLPHAITPDNRSTHVLPFVAVFHGT